MSSTPQAALALGLGIALEVLATALLQESRQFTRPGYATAALLLYGMALFLVSLSLRTIPLGVAYAIWSGVGIVLVAAIGRLVHGQRLDPATLAGLGLIVAGVLVVNLVGGTTRGG